MQPLADWGTVKPVSWLSAGVLVRCASTCVFRIQIYEVDEMTVYPHHESFYSHRIWESVGDQWFALEFLVLRGEYQTITTQDQINTHRLTRKTPDQTVVKRVKCVDAVFCERYMDGPWRLEYGPMESGRASVGRHIQHQVDL